MKREKKVVGFVGNLVPVKGADRLPDIFDSIYEKCNQETEFVVIGDGELRKQIEKQNKKLI